jgi:hypothetical protein
MMAMMMTLMMTLIMELNLAKVDYYFKFVINLYKTSCLGPQQVILYKMHGKQIRSMNSR